MSYISSAVYVCIGMLLRMIVYAVVYAAVYVVVISYVLNEKSYRLLGTSEKSSDRDKGESLTIRAYQALPERVNQ